MQVEPNTIAVFHYRVSDATDESRTAIDSSQERGAPLAVLVGGGNVVPGLEKALIGHVAGDTFEVTVPPAEGHGEYREGWTQRVPKKYFAPDAKLEPGQITFLNMQQGGQRRVTVLKVGSSVVDVDLNTPLAGRTLLYEIELLNVREASREEIAHRHAHGADGGETHSHG